MSTTTIEHRDVTPAAQPYIDGKFVSLCSCGAEFFGDDPDHADYLLLDHICPDDTTR
ncbi:hypothetical protein FB561_2777 [Kribbella amoyensis]|uniref:Uncharacterized protein n=1 Tax=Kribbella amoyensis TaxID=996641 RepID=A0A561BRY6_9ACTN|nr:hypothetical protein [Kribbella amoyensis]TWD81657.1 hypothetical protein FB561_2777 [Kribbella amoyensis]